jgi:hypothetical protein
VFQSIQFIMARKSPSLPKSAPAKKLVAAYRAVYAVGVLAIFLGLLALVAPIPDHIALAIIFLVFGAFYLFLGFLVRRRSMTALGIAIGLMALNLLAGIWNMIETGKPVGLLVPILFLTQTWEGFEAIKELNKQKI